MSNWRNMLMTKRALSPLTFTAQTANATITLNVQDQYDNLVTSGLLYRIDKNSGWRRYYVGNPITLNSIGDCVQFMNTETKLSLDPYVRFYFSMTGRIAASGSIQSMCNWVDYAPYYAYCRLFDGCTSLTTAPSLTARSIRGYSYYKMFLGCTALKVAPDITSELEMIEAPAYHCCASMFEGCTSLVKAPLLPTNRVQEYCYSNMFNGCTSLVTAPVLPCLSLTTGCYSGMFKGCSSLINAPELPATDMDSECYADMFSGCAKLQAIKVGFSSWYWTGTYGFSSGWMTGVSSVGTFYKKSALAVKRGVDYVPEGWTVVDID